MMNILTDKRAKKFSTKITILCFATLFAGCNEPTSHQSRVDKREAAKVLVDSAGADQRIRSDQGMSTGGASSSSVISVDSIYPGVLSEPPTLHVDRIGSYAGNKITITTNLYRGSVGAVEDAGIMANWKILDAAGAVVLNQEGRHQLEWTPATEGIYTVKHTMLQENIEVSITESLYVLKEVTQDTDITDRFWTMDEKLLGVWSGQISSPRGEDTKVSVVFYEDGSYVISRILRNGLRSPYPLDRPRPRPPMIPPPGYGMGGGGGIPFDIAYMEPFPYPDSSSIFFDKEKGIFELLDIWANGEALGSMQSNISPPMVSENMKRIRFNEEYDMVFFELSMDPFFTGNSETFVLTRVSDVAEPPGLEVIREKVIGEWKGSAMTPWAVPYDVSFTFNDDGTYQASSLTDTFLHDGSSLGRVSALYFGAVDQVVDTVLYTLDVFDNGVASGDISLELKNGDIVTGTISELEMSIDYSLMIFTFEHYGKYGPIRYVLERQ